MKIAGYTVAALGVAYVINTWCIAKDACLGGIK